MIQEIAVRLVLAATHSPSELVKLRQSEPIGILDHHHGGIGYIDPDLYHGRRYQHIDHSISKGAHDSIFLCRAHLSMHQTQPEIWEYLSFQSTVLRYRRLSFQRVRLLY